MTEARQKFYGSVQLSTGQLEVLIFADDLVMLAETEKALQHNLQELNERLDEWGMNGNWRRSARKEGIDKGDRTEGGECYGDSHVDLRV